MTATLQSDNKGKGAGVARRRQRLFLFILLFSGGIVFQTNFLIYVMAQVWLHYRHTNQCWWNTERCIEMLKDLLVFLCWFFC